MKKKNYCLLLLLLVSPLLLKSQFLAADINKSLVGSDPSFVRAGIDYFVFTALSDQYGRELFVSDGTETGTKLVKDISSGNASSQFWEVTIIDSLCYFITSPNAETLQYWCTSLKKPEPVLLKTFTVNGISGGQNGKFTKLGDQVYFLHRNANYLMELWKTDRTPTGTTRVFEFGRNVFPNQLSAFNKQLIFLAEDKAGLSQLWKSDGSSNGTTLIKSVDTQYGTFEYAVFKDMIYFVANDGISGWEMWQSDGSANGTKLFIDLIPGTESGAPTNLTVVGDNLFFTAYDAANGPELWRTKGTPQTTQLVKDIRAGAQGSTPFSFKNFNNTLYFLAQDGAVGTELWKSDGTAQGTQLVKDIFTGPGSAFGNNRLQSTSDGIHFFFVAKDSLQGWALWRSDGTLTGTNRVYSILPTVNATEITELIAHKRSIYFKTQDGRNGQELWKTDGTEKGTTIFTKLNFTGASSFPYQMKVVNNLLMFSAKTETEGFELWKSDGTASGTQLVKDIYLGVESSNLLLPTSFKNNYVFTASYAPGSRQVWKSDGTEKGTVLLKNINENRGGTSTEGIAVLKDKLIFNAYREKEGEELWISDGTEAGTKLLKDINPVGQSLPFIPLNPAILKDSLLFFSAHDGLTGVELWKTNGTPEGTALVADIRPFDQSPNVYYFHVGMMTNVNETLFFTADNGTLGGELWKTDGTTQGTQLVKDIWPGIVGSSPGSGISFKNSLYFNASDELHGTELWKSDGTFNGTVLVKDILPGAVGALPINFVVHNNELYFVVANDGEERYALWKTDGTSEGTVRVKRIAANDNKSYIRPPFSWGKHLYFSSDDGIHGYELWRSDGTEEGTVMLFDLNKGPASSEPDNFTPFKNDLYFSADDGIHGQELWRLNASTTVSTTETTIAELLIFPNPATDKLTIRNTVENQALYISLFDSNGKMVINRYLLRDSAKDFDVRNLSAGLYVLEMSEEASGKRYSKKIVIVR